MADRSHLQSLQKLHPIDNDRCAQKQCKPCPGLNLRLADPASDGDPNRSIRIGKTSGQLERRLERKLSESTKSGAESDENAKLGLTSELRTFRGNHGATI